MGLRRGGRFARHTVLARKLSEDEFEIMKTHTLRGGDILEGIPFLSRSHEIALSHHEHYNGRGYPYGLASDDIPLSGRIVALADVFDALTSKRCYKDAFPLEKALDIIRGEEGKQFDPEVMAAFFSQLDPILEIFERHH